METILAQEDTGVLCLARNNEPYGVPISYAFLEGSIVFHCGLSGKKLNFLKENPRVCLVVARHPDRLKPHHPEGGCHYRFESVIISGRAMVIESVMERLEVLRKFKSHFDERLKLLKEANPVTLNAAEKCGCVIISIDSMTGRRKD